MDATLAFYSDENRPWITFLRLTKNMRLKRSDINSIFAQRIILISLTALLCQYQYRASAAYPDHQPPLPEGKNHLNWSYLF